MNCLQRILNVLKYQPDKIALTGVDGANETCRFSNRQLVQKITSVKNSLLQQGIRKGDSVPILASTQPDTLITTLALMSLGALSAPVDPLTNKLMLDQISNNKFCCNDEIMPVLLMHSSGSSGVPKNILYSSKQLEFYMQRHDYLYRQYSDITGKQVYQSDLICALPLFHFAGLALCFQALMMGRTLHIQQNFRLEDYLYLAIKKEVHLLMLVPSMFEGIKELSVLPVLPIPPSFPAVQTNRHGKSYIKYCITGGEAISKKLTLAIKEYLKAEVFIVCGLSECQTGLGHSQISIDNCSSPIGSCGQLLFGEVKLMAEDDCRENNYVGELWVRNDTTFPCYSNSTLNQHRFVRGWFKTGDILRRDNQGFYYYCGRKDNMFIVNGKNIYPEEIEHVFIKHSAVSQVLAFPLVTSTGKVFPGVIIKLKKNNFIPTESELIDYYLQHGQRHSIPGWIYFINKFPQLAQGKIDRNKCETLLQDNYQNQFKSVAS